MFYYLIFKSSLSGYSDIHSKLIASILYGSILYIALHAYMSSTSIPFVQNLKSYFWIIFSLDLASMSYFYLMTESTDTATLSSAMNTLATLKSTLAAKLGGLMAQPSDVDPLPQTQPHPNPPQSHDTPVGGTGTYSTEISTIRGNLESGIDKNNISDELTQLLQNTPVARASDTASNASGSDIGSVGDIDIQDFSASL